MFYCFWITLFWFVTCYLCWLCCWLIFAFCFVVCYAFWFTPVLDLCWLFWFEFDFDVVWFYICLFLLFMMLFYVLVLILNCILWFDVCVVVLYCLILYAWIDFGFCNYFTSELFAGCFVFDLDLRFSLIDWWFSCFVFVSGLYWLDWLLCCFVFWLSFAACFGCFGIRFEFWWLAGLFCYLLLVWLICFLDDCLLFWLFCFWCLFLIVCLS